MAHTRWIDITREPPPLSSDGVSLAGVDLAPLVEIAVGVVNGLDFLVRRRRRYQVILVGDIEDVELLATAKSHAIAVEMAIKIAKDFLDSGEAVEIRGK
ncbi:hypothetical protein [Knoellia subterranea]|nr:hypothetical protein [Knoellia subterranea]